ncbi:glutamate--cysteine ligase [Actinomadura sp. 9N407]|uniref:glutamate--cysteine ligase n=1 Tax=Actinomadura sp. 9N407 TaxID=3375154 RepID=UPI00378D9BDD
MLKARVPRAGTGISPARAGAGLTLGVEEEFLLVDPVSGTPVPYAGRVLAAAGEHPFDGGRYHRELLKSQVEAATGVCDSLDGARGQIRDARARLAAATAREGFLLLSTGTPVLPGPVPVSDHEERYAAISRMYAGIVADYQACGCHVHVGVGGRETAVAVCNHLRPWLPALLALSANSPFDHGRDSGHASWRMIEQSRFPGSGVPPAFASAADHDRAVDLLVDCGVVADPAMSFWLARPSPHLPTVEVRAADAAATADDAVLQAAITRALVRTALDDLSAGREAPDSGPDVCAAAVWTAARYGLEGPAIHPFEERQVPVRRLLGDLMFHITPALEETGDLAEVRALLTWVMRTGSGASRQRQAASDGGLRALVRMLARQTAATPERGGR